MQGFYSIGLEHFLHHWLARTEQANLILVLLSTLAVVSSSLPVQQQPKEAPEPEHFQPFLLLLPQLQWLPRGATSHQQQDTFSTLASRGEWQPCEGEAHFPLTS